MKRGEVRWYEFQPPDKRRPVLILSRDSAIAVLNEVTIAPITSTIRAIATEIALGVEDGMACDCAANFDHLQTVPKQKLGRLITTLSSVRMHEAAICVCFALGFDEMLRQNI